MFIEAVPGNLKSNLEVLGKEAYIEKFYLAGGTACALQIGHRVSRDLDFFTPQNFSVEKVMATMAELGGDLTVDVKKDDTFLGSWNGIKISFFFYRYPLLFAPQKFSGALLADLRDIACMKIDAIQSRGKKRDFVDLWAMIHEGHSLPDMFGLFAKKFEGAQFNTVHILKSLSYFEDAEGDEMPEMLWKVSWEDVKSFFLQETKRLVWPQ